MTFGKPIESLDVKSEYVSFDIFDTLIVRDCGEPVNIFRIMDREHSGFYATRIEAERLARDASASEEVTLDEIYDQIEKTYGWERVQTLKALEQSTELLYCCPNLEVKYLYDELRACGKHVLLISDMYLPRQSIEAMLEKCGIIGYEKLYISSELGITKRSGKLFDYIARENGIDNRQWTHIGDHPMSDFLVPKKHGINAFLYCRCSPNRDYLRDMKLNGRTKQYTIMLEDYAILKSICYNSVQASSDAYILGNHVLGPMLYGFSTWLHQWCVANGVDRLYFLSREGKLLKTAFDILYDTGEISTCYINVSRLALCRANIVRTHNYPELMDLMASLLRNVTQVDELLKLIGLKQYIPFICGDLSINADIGLHGVDEEHLYSSIMKYGLTFFQEQSRLLREYLASKGIKAPSAALVDVGWSGTMQLMLSKAIPTCHFTGNYIAVSSFNNHEGYEALDRNGYWCNADEWETKGKIFRFSLSALEELLMTDEGTTLEYQKQNGEVVPVKLQEMKEPRMLQRIADTEMGICDFMRECRGKLLNSDARVFLWPYMCFAVYPTMKSVEVLKDYTFINGVHESSILPQHSLPYYIVHPKAAVVELEENVNKTIWMKALFKLPLSYHKLLCLMTDKIGMKSKFQKQYFAK